MMRHCRGSDDHGSPLGAHVLVRVHEVLEHVVVDHVARGHIFVAFQIDGEAGNQRVRTNFPQKFHRLFVLPAKYMSVLFFLSHWEESESHGQPAVQFAPPPPPLASSIYFPSYEDRPKQQIEGRWRRLVNKTEEGKGGEGGSRERIRLLSNVQSCPRDPPEDSRCLSCLPEAIPVFQHDRVVTDWGVSSMADIASPYTHAASSAIFPCDFGCKTSLSFPRADVLWRTLTRIWTEIIAIYIRHHSFQFSPSLSGFATELWELPCGVGQTLQAKSHRMWRQMTTRRVLWTCGMDWTMLRFPANQTMAREICFDHFIPQSVPR